MQTLITPTVVVARAFADGEYIAPETVSEAAIVAAQETYLRPVTGDALFERLLAGDHADFADEYLAAPLALYVRYLIAPQLDLRHGQGANALFLDGHAASRKSSTKLPINYSANDNPYKNAFEGDTQSPEPGTLWGF